jgi:AhpD family alkylhydroperoxidase
MELVKIRASQINGCAFCLHMHTAAARKQGEPEERLYLLRRLARIAALQRAGARRARLDRGADAAVRDARAR